MSAQTRRGVKSVGLYIIPWMIPKLSPSLLLVSLI